MDLVRLPVNDHEHRLALAQQLRRSAASVALSVMRNVSLLGGRGVERPGELR